MTSERRRFLRVAFAAPAQLITPQNRFNVQVLDLSFKGALVSAPPNGAVLLGSLYTLALTLAEIGASISMATKVVHMEEEHLGLLCQEIDIDSMTHLRRLIELNLGDPQLLERELKALTLL